MSTVGKKRCRWCESVRNVLTIHILACIVDDETADEESCTWGSCCTENFKDLYALLVRPIMQNGTQEEDRCIGDWLLFEEVAR